MPTVEAYKDFIRKHKEKNCPPHTNKKKEQLKKLAEKFGYEGKEKTKKVYTDYIKQHKKENCPSYSNKKKEQLKRLAERLGYEAKKAPKKVKTQPEMKQVKTQPKPVKQMEKKPKPPEKKEVKTQPPEPAKKEVKAPEPKLTQQEIKLPNNADYKKKRKTFLSALTSVWRKANTLIDTWFKDRYKPEFDRAAPLVENAETSEERQTASNAWKKTEEELKRELESQLNPLRDSYDRILRQGEGLNLKVKRFPDPYNGRRAFRIYHNLMDHFLQLPLKAPVKKTYSELKSKTEKKMEKKRAPEAPKPKIQQERKMEKKKEPEVKEPSQLEWLVNNYSGLKTTREWNNFKKRFGGAENSEILNILGDKRNAVDFYPTPPKCILDHERLVDLIKNRDVILEPSAGFGSLVWTLQKINPTAEIHANELMRDFKSFNDRELPDVEWSYGDFLKQPISQWDGVDLIVCNPPFTNGNDKRFYYNFYYKCLQIMNSGKKDVSYDMIFLCPENELHKEYGMPSKITRQKAEQILDMLGKPSKITPKQWKRMKNGDDYDNEALEYLEGLAPIQINYISDCEFKTTGARVSVYHIIAFGQG